jgi:hypothetical protein
MCKKRIKLMKIIPKIVLYAAIILLLSISLDERAGSQVEPSKANATSIKRQTKIEAAPYNMVGKIKVENPVYKEKIVINSNLKLDH